MRATYGAKDLPVQEGKTGAKCGQPIRGISPHPGKKATGRITPADRTRFVTPSPFSPKRQTFDRERKSHTLSLDLATPVISPKAVPAVVRAVSPRMLLSIGNDNLQRSWKLPTHTKSPPIPREESRFRSGSRLADKLPTYKSIQSRPVMGLLGEDGSLRKVQE